MGEEETCPSEVKEELGTCKVAEMEGHRDLISEGIAHTGGLPRSARAPGSRLHSGGARVASQPGGGNRAGPGSDGGALTEAMTEMHGSRRKRKKRWVRSTNGAKSDGVVRIAVHKQGFLRGGG